MVAARACVGPNLRVTMPSADSQWRRAVGIVALRPRQIGRVVETTRSVPGGRAAGRIQRSRSPAASAAPHHRCDPSRRSALAWLRRAEARATLDGPAASLGLRRRSSVPATPPGRSGRHGGTDRRRVPESRPARPARRGEASAARPRRSVRALLADLLQLDENCRQALMGSRERDGRWAGQPAIRRRARASSAGIAVVKTFKLSKGLAEPFQPFRLPLVGRTGRRCPEQRAVECRRSARNRPHRALARLRLPVPWRAKTQAIAQARR